jgi:hypothetical protein
LSSLCLTRFRTTLKRNPQALSRQIALYIDIFEKGIVLNIRKKNLITLKQKCSLLPDRLGRAVAGLQEVAPAPRLQHREDRGPSRRLAHHRGRQRDHRVPDTQDRRDSYEKIDR